MPEERDMREDNEVLKGMQDDDRDNRNNNNENSNKKPIMTIAMIAVTTLIFLYSNLVDEALYDTWSASNIDMFIYREWYRAFTAIFMHGSVEHLVWNMVVLGCAGDLMERRIGAVRFTVIYLFSGVVANFCAQAIYFSQNEMTASIGASGSVFGLIGLILCIVLLHKGHVEDITLPRVAIMIGLCLYDGFTSEGVDNTAHIMGLVAGFIISFVLVTRKELKKIHE